MTNDYAARKQSASQARGQWIEQQEAAEAAFVQEMQAEQERRDAEAQVCQQAFDVARWKQEDYAEGARWEAQQAYQRYRQGERADPQPKSLWRAGDSMHGIISALPNIVDGVNAGFEIIRTTRAARQVSYEQIGNQIIVRGSRSARQALGLNPYTNRINLENAPRLLAENPPTRSLRSVSSGWTLAGILLNAGVDYYSYKTGEYDQQEFGAALLFDTSATIISAAVGGFVAGAVAGAIAGSPALGIGAIPGAAIGGVVGAIAGIGTSLALNYYVRDWYISTASHGWDWLGQ